MTLTKNDLKSIGEVVDEKLDPIKKDLSEVKNDLNSVKTIVNREFIKVNSRLDRLEEISLAIVEDINDHDTRIKRLEKHKKISSSN